MSTTRDTYCNCSVVTIVGISFDHNFLNMYWSKWWKSWNISYYICIVFVWNNFDGYYFYKDSIVRFQLKKFIFFLMRIQPGSIQNTRILTRHNSQDRLRHLRSFDMLLPNVFWIEVKKRDYYNILRMLDIKNI